MPTLARPIETDRLRLRPFTDGDLDYVADLFGRPDVVRYLYRDVQTRDEVKTLLDKRKQRTSLNQPGEQVVLAVERKDTGRVIGVVLLSWEANEHRTGETGFIFHPDHHGQGFATEAAREMLRLGFEEVSLHRIIGRCDARNAASAKLMARLGMRQEAHFIDNEWVKGEWTSELVYAMLQDEWKSSHR